jgi:cytochrome oxidase assembly protein ShyY1
MLHWNLFLFLLFFSLVTRRTAALQSEPLDLVTYLKTHSGGFATAGEAVSSSASAGSSLAPSSKGTSDPADVVLSEECRRMTARGRFLHGRTLLLGPRSPPSPDGASTAGQGIGYFLITPFRLADGRLVLVNRGWCAKDKCAPGSVAHLETDKDEEVEIVGVLRKGEQVRQRSLFFPPPGSVVGLDRSCALSCGVAATAHSSPCFCHFNIVVPPCTSAQHPQFLTDSYDPLKSESFIWLDLPLMARATGVTEPGATDEPVLLDALEVNGNKNRNMRRRTVGDYIVFTTTPMIHSVYAATWFTLSAALVALTYIRFKKKVPQQARTAINRR